jgi:hypothetical protein
MKNRFGSFHLTYPDGTTLPLCHHFTSPRPSRLYLSHVLSFSPALLAFLILSCSHAVLRSQSVRFDLLVVIAARLIEQVSGSFVCSSFLVLCFVRLWTVVVVTRILRKTPTAEEEVGSVLVCFPTWRLLG